MNISKRMIVLGSLATALFVCLTAMRSSAKINWIKSHSNYKDTSGTNLKVLPQNISADSLYDLMEGYGTALGVNCSHCHVMKNQSTQEDYLSDAVPAKSTARQMILMTDSINRNSKPVLFPFKPVQKITCITCHKGKPIPDSVIVRN